jgi:hypothetical protein
MVLIATPRRLRAEVVVEDDEEGEGEEADAPEVVVAPEVRLAEPSPPSPPQPAAGKASPASTASDATARLISFLVCGIAISLRP